MDFKHVIIEDLVSHAKAKGVKIYYVGGIVRDIILGATIKDIDIVVEGDAIEFCESLEGAEILSVHSDFGTCKVRFCGKEIDFASTREETYPQSGCLPVVQNIGCPLPQDVLRRDFTLNAIALDLENGEIIDYVGGVEDLREGVLRVLHLDSFIDDPTRILRALDFELRFGFELIDEVQFADNREGLSMSRVDLTLKKVLKNEDAYEEIIERELYKIFQDEAPEIPPSKLKEAIEKFGTDDPVAIYFKAVKNDLPELMSAQTNYETYLALRPLVKEIRPLITGDDLMALGVSEGPKIGEILEKLLEEKLNNPNSAPKTRDEELEFAKALL